MDNPQKLAAQGTQDPSEAPASPLVFSALVMLNLQFSVKCFVVDECFVVDQCLSLPLLNVTSDDRFGIFNLFCINQNITYMFEMTSYRFYTFIQYLHVVSNKNVDIQFSAHDVFLELHSPGTQSQNICKPNKLVLWSKKIKQA